MIMGKAKYAAHFINFINFIHPINSLYIGVYIRKLYHKEVKRCLKDFQLLTKDLRILIKAI